MVWSEISFVILRLSKHRTSPLVNNVCSLNLALRSSVAQYMTQGEGGGVCLNASVCVCV